MGQREGPLSVAGEECKGAEYLWQEPCTVGTTPSQWACILAEADGDVSGGYACVVALQGGQAGWLPAQHHVSKPSRH